MSRLLLLALATRDAERAVRRVLDLANLAGSSTPTVRILDDIDFVEVPLASIADALADDAARLQRALLREKRPKSKADE